MSTDSSEAAMLRQHLGADDERKYELKHYNKLAHLKSIELESFCHAVLLDIRDGNQDVQQSIEWIGKLQSRVALICICHSHTQLQHFKSVTHLIDDYILTENLAHEELPTRIGHAIRRRIKEHELLREQNLLHSLLENIPDSIYFKDRSSKFVKLSAAMARSYGHSGKSLIGKSDFDLFTDEHARPAYEDEQKIIHTGKSVVGKIEKETLADGEIRWASTTKLPLKDSLGRTIGTMGISRDITELKTAQENLDRESVLLKTIIDHALAGIFVKDRKGRYLLVNKKHADYLGTDTESVKGTCIADYFDRDMAEQIMEADEAIMHSRKGVENMIDKRERPGMPLLWLLTSKVPLINSHGDCTGLVGISIDITKQVINEQKLKDTIKTLEETKLQLIEAEKLKTVGRLAAGVAHEVKNPLNVVSLGVEYLLSQVTEPQQLLEIIGDMRLAIEKANNVIFELLDYSSPRDVSMQPTDMNALIHRVLSFLRHNFNEAHILIDVDLSSELPTIPANTPKMEQVFINLFLNAIHAMGKGGTLEVSTYTHRMQSAGSNVSSEMTELFRIGDRILTIEVRDTGSGVEAKDIAKLFDPFYSTKSTGEGTGLGLSVTRSIVEMHRGMISLTNRRDLRGACATLHFPTTPKDDV